MNFDAFISYSHAADGQLAPALQSALHRFAKPWYKLRSLHIFRDKTSLSATPSLWPSIESALSESKFFLLMASPEASRSKWVTQEISWWLQNRSIETIFIILTSGDLVWSSDINNFHPIKTTAIPEILYGQFQTEPLHVDLRWAKTMDNLSLRHSQFRAAILDLAAPLHQRPKDELDGEDVRIFRSTRRIVIGVGITILAFSGYAVWQRHIAEQQRDLAQEQTKIATSRQIAAQALNDFNQHKDDRALLQSVAATRIKPTPEALQTLFLIVQKLQRNLGFFWGDQNDIINRYSDDPTPMYGVAFSPDGNVLASGSADQKIRLWNVPNHKFIKALEGHPGEIWSVAFSADGTHLASSGRENISLWDVSTGKLLGNLLADNRFVSSITFSPDGTLLASSDTNSEVRLWNVASRSLVGTFGGHRGAVNTITFSPDGKLLAGGNSLDSTVRLWDVNNFKLLGTLSGHHKSILSIIFSPDGKTLASAGEDKTVRLWDVASRKLINIFEGHDNAIISLSFSRNSQVLASASLDNSVRLWNIPTRQSKKLDGYRLDETRGLFQHVAFNADSSRLASTYSNGSLILWDVSVSQPFETLEDHMEEPVNSIVFSPDGSLLASGSGKHAFASNHQNQLPISKDSTIRLWDISSRKLITIFKGHRDAVNSVAFSADGKVLASGSGGIDFDSGSNPDNTVRLWDVRTHKLVATLEGHQDRVENVALSPDGITLASSGAEKVIRLWNLGSQKQIATLTIGKDDVVNDLDFSPDGKILAAAYAANGIALWDAASRRLIAVKKYITYGTKSIAFSPDGRLVAVGGDNALLLLEVNNLTKVGEFRTSDDNDVLHLAFSPDGKFFASTNNKRIEMWDVATQKHLVTLTGHTDNINSIAFSPDGRTLVSGGDDKRIILWPVGIEFWQNVACAIVNRNLLPDEKRELMGEAWANQNQELCPIK